MKRSNIFLSLALLAIQLVAGAAENPLITYTPPVSPIEVEPEKCPVQIFISPTGKDTASGKTSDQPFATLEKARDEIRQLKTAGPLPAGGVAVNLLEGVYSRDHSFELGAQDSGTEAAPIIYRAAKDAAVRILGGRKMTAADFSTELDLTEAARLDPAARGHVLKANIEALGLKHGGPFPTTFNGSGGIFELFFNGARMSLSRWPVKGYTTMKEVIVNGEKSEPGAFAYRDDRPARWDVSRGVWLKGQWRVGWEDPVIQVAKIDTGLKQITFATGISGGIGNKYTRPKGNGKEPWCALNLLEEITQPGQWCIDFTSKTLFFWPPAPIESADVLISQLDQPIIRGNEVSHVSFIGLTFENSLGDAIVLQKSERDLIAGCTIRNLAGHGVVANGTGLGIQSCDMFGLGEGCIVISGGDRKTLTPSGNYVINNHLHNYAVLRAQYSAAIDLYHDNQNAPAVGHLVAHNLIHHAPRDAVLFAGNDNVFEYNEIHRCAYDSADVGAFYSWLDWTIRGIVIRYNFVHDTVGGVNPDDGSSGTFVYGNIFAGDRTGVYIASGPDHVIEDNIFVKSQGPVFGIDDRGMGRKYATNERLLKPVRDVNPTQPPWSVRYPEMATLLEDHPELPLRSKFRNNLVVIQSGEPTQAKMKPENAQDLKLLEITGNFVTAADPGFRNLAANDFTLESNSAVFEKIPGFPKIPVEKIGLYQDEYRKRLPTDSEAGRLPEQDPWKVDDGNRNFGT